MGSGKWDTGTYTTAKLHRSATHMADFHYSEVIAPQTQEIHTNLDPTRIRNKPFKALESRDSAEHPESNAVMVCFDVTGSNYNNAIEAQKKLPNLMNLLVKYLPDPQVAIAANDDYNYVGRKCLQISDYESDNRVLRTQFLREWRFKSSLAHQDWDRWPSGDGIGL